MKEGRSQDTIAIVAAGGSGSRVRAPRPKQFLDLAGKPLLAHTVARFVQSPDVGSVVVVLPREDFERHAQLMTRWIPPGDNLKIVSGGDSRQDSVWRGISTIPGSFEGYVLVHDGARPLVSQETIRNVVAAAKRFGGAIAGLPVTETLKEVGPDPSNAAVIVATVDRRLYYHAQTPQCFRHRTLRTALEQARAAGFLGTDEAQLVERLGEKVYLVPGSVRNIKVTTREHLALAEYYLKLGERGEEDEEGAGS
jgi:2-C-methyl-D-erythritol 4-phosphate cytidylyltransferase